MSGFRTKVFLVQKASGELVGAKLTFDAAHRLAKSAAPAQVLFAYADKTDQPNVADHDLDRMIAINCKSESRR